MKMKGIEGVTALPAPRKYLMSHFIFSGIIDSAEQEITEMSSPFITNCSGYACGLKISHKSDQAPLENKFLLLGNAKYLALRLIENII